MVTSAPSWRCAGSPSASAPSRRSTDVDLEVARARWSRWSATTAPASPPWSSRSPGSTRRRGRDRVGGRPVTCTGPRTPSSSARHRLPGPRALRQPRRGRQPLPRPRAPPVGRLDEVAMEKRARTARHALDPDPQRAHPGRRAVRRPAPGGRDRPRPVGEPEGRHPRRADRRARRRADRPGPRPGRAAPRPGPRRHPDQPQHGGRARPSRTRSRCCASAATTASSRPRHQPGEHHLRHHRRHRQRRDPAPGPGEERVGTTQYPKGPAEAAARVSDDAPPSIPGCWSASRACRLPGRVQAAGAAAASWARCP